MVRQEDIKRLNRAMDTLMQIFSRKAAAVDKAMGEFSLQELKATYVLGQSKLLKQSQLAEKLMLSVSNTSILAERMVRKGLVERKHDAKDRRIVRLRLTKKGAACYRTMLQHHLSCGKFILGKLSTEEQQRFIVLMEKVAGRGLQERGG
jgi:DNA-binding MarR family transcriptional regulator